MKIKIGDYVRVKKGIRDPDFDMFLIGGYQGRVFSIEETGCKWVSQIEEEPWCAGFQITSISDGGLEELGKIIRILLLHPETIASLSVPFGR